MKTDRQRQLQDLFVFFLLVGDRRRREMGTARMVFHPTAAAAIFAGWYFSHWAIAMLVPTVDSRDQRPDVARLR